MRRAIPAVLALSAFLAHSGTAVAAEVRIGTGISWVRDSSYDVFHGDDDMADLDVCLSYAVVSPGPFIIEVEAGYRYAGFDAADVAFAAVSTQLKLHEGYAGVRGSIDPGLSWLRPYVRVQGGALFGVAKFHDATSGAWALEDWAPAATVYSAGGVELVLPWSVFFDSPREMLTEPLALGAFVEAGYSYRSDLAFFPSRPAPDDDAVAADLIPVAGFSAGDLALSGPVLRFGVVARF